MGVVFDRTAWSQLKSAMNITKLFLELLTIMTCRLGSWSSLLNTYILA
jgi:hypothetical protein